MTGSSPSARGAARVRWMAILASLIVALLLSVAVPRADAYTMRFKHKKMASVTKESGVMILDALAFNVITEAPRNYSVVVVLTAMSPQIGCAACHRFEPEFKAVSYSRSKAPGQHPLYFASIDFESGREVFQCLGLQSAPNVFLYPATTGPFKLDDGGAPYLNYDLARRGVAAKTLAEWLSSAINEPLPVMNPLTMWLNNIWTNLCYSDACSSLLPSPWLEAFDTREGSATADIEWLKVNGKGIEGDGKNWGGTNTNIYYSASLIWGAIGPIRFFFESAYSGLIISGLVIGLVLPPLLKLGSLITDKIPWKLIQAPILFQVGSPGSYQSSVLMSFFVSTFFQFFMYRYHRGWWTRYNYVLATALDVGVAFCVLLVNAAFSQIELPTWFLNPDADTLGVLGDTCHPPEDNSRWQLSFD
ncbi:oligosaccharyl transferase subunit ost3/OST6 [Allomyces javanicus]|nr:oligosaccharyl transferase subunit ost3/OST6 [Allomyces javanicus]